MTHSGDHRLSKACRAVLRGATSEEVSVREHVEACTFCHEWLQRRKHLTGLLGQSVESPAGLRSPQLLERIRESIVESCEGSPLGQALGQAMPMAPPDAEEWPEPLLESGLLESDLPESGLASQIRTVHVGPPEWSEVRDSVLAGLSSRRASRTLRNRVFASAGVAAAIVMCALLLRENEHNEQPEIVFTDMASVPGHGFSPMSILRTGRQR